MAEAKDGYADRAQSYSQFADQSFSWRFIERPAFDRNIPDSCYSAISAVADLGSGSGRILVYHLLRGIEEENLTGLEASRSMIEIAQAKLPNVRFVHSLMEKMPLSANSYDLVTACLALRYIDNGQLEKVFVKVKDILKPGGLFFLLDVHPARYGLVDGFDRYFFEEERTVPTPWGDTDVYYYRRIDTYLNQVVNAGLAVQRLDECPIDPMGKDESLKDFDKYQMSPARFAMLASKG